MKSTSCCTAVLHIAKSSTCPSRMFSAAWYKSPSVYCVWDGRCLKYDALGGSTESEDGSRGVVWRVYKRCGLLMHAQPNAPAEKYSTYEIGKAVLLARSAERWAVLKWLSGERDAFARPGRAFSCKSGAPQPSPRTAAVGHCRNQTSFLKTPYAAAQAAVVSQAPFVAGWAKRHAGPASGAASRRAPSTRLLEVTLRGPAPVIHTEEDRTAHDAPSAYRRHIQRSQPPLPRALDSHSRPPPPPGLGSPRPPARGPKARDRGRMRARIEARAGPATPGSWGACTHPCHAAAAPTDA
eukprot:scaffold978_cov392-Prasinococcus_capsulatus_cf.AAC.12